MDQLLQQWIAEIIAQNQQLIRIAVRQRAKFEGWLKFELAALAEQKGATFVKVESSQKGNPQRADISFVFDRASYDVELKTPNTNWRVPGVLNLTRPITNNIAEIIEDGRKLMLTPNLGIVAFVMFPIRPQDSQWLVYLDRIANELNIPLTETRNCKRVYSDLGENNVAELIICAFTIPKRTAQ